MVASSPHHPGARLALVCAVSLAAVAGCGLRQSLPGYELRAGASPAGVLVQGRLEVIDGCVLLVAQTGQRFPLLWESHFTASSMPFAVYGPAGTLLASEGDEVWLGGDEVPAPAPGCPGVVSFWVLSLETDDPIAD